MGIDRIGKGAPPPAPETAGVDKRGPTHETFSVDRGEGARKVEGSTAADATSPLARLRAGEIDVNAYADLTAEEATKGLEGLSPGELADIKKVLRDQMATDPALVDLVRTAAGTTASEPDE
jgi:hypothetical protein